MRAEGQAAVERLLARLGKPFWAVFHVHEQKCELGFRVEVTTSQDALRYDLRFWGCPEWDLHRIRRFLARRRGRGPKRTSLPRPARTLDLSVTGKNTAPAGIAPRPGSERTGGTGFEFS